jgi:hypothetical protein
MRDWDSWEDVDGTFHAARARVEALHADARNAGLRELRAWIDANDGGIRGNMNHYDFAMAQTFGRVRDKIDAKLGGNGE